MLDLLKMQMVFPALFVYLHSADSYSMDHSCQWKTNSDRSLLQL